MSPPTILLAGAILLAALYCGTDPFRHSAIADFPEFEAHAVELPPLAAIPVTRDPEDRLQKAEVRFLGEVQGPESIAFDPLGRGPYTGVADGRVVFWNGEAWSNFAYTSSNRSELCDPKPSATSYLKNEHICGRPLGLRFDKKTGDLYIADAYFGLLKVGPEGGLATSLTTEAEGIPLKFTNDLDIDEDGIIYFTDSSTNYQRRNFMQLVFSAEPSGRLLKYDPNTKETTVLLRDLQFPNGVSLSKDKSFFLFCEGLRGRLSKYWLKGEKAGTTEVFATLPGFPDNVRTNEKGEFWVAIHCRRTLYAYLISIYPRLRKFLLSLPIPVKYHYMFRIGGKLHALIIKYGPDGEILEVLEDRHTPKARLQHGDIISFIALPHDEKSYAFVYREARNPVSLANGTVMKRKSEEYCTESKRLKGIGIGSHDGPISLDDVRSLQRSNTELRHQLESHVITIEILRNESRECISRHEKDLKELKETTETSFLDQIKELKGASDMKQKEIDKFATLSAELQSSVNDLKERLGASIQSRVDADEIVNSQKTTISDLEAQLNEERKQRREEREKAEADLKSALQRAHSEAEMGIKRQSDGYLRQQKEQQEVFSKLQESEKESRVLVEVLRSKLGDARESLVLSEKKVRQLEVLLLDEQTSYANSRKKVESLESELNRLRKDLESEKVAREEAWAKVSALELEIAAAIRDLSQEKQRFQGAREKIILRETQLRAFYSTTEEISSLFVKQQEQLKSMQKTLEDEENCGNTSTGIDLNEPAVGNANIAYAPLSKPANLGNNTREAPGSSSPKNVQATYISSDDDAANDFDDSATEKQDGYARIQEDNTQDLDGLNSDRLVKDTDGVGTAVVPDDDPTDTEQVLGTESPIGGTGFINHAGNTMQLDVETQAQDNMEHTEKPEEATGHCSESRMEDTETGTVKTADLLASEVAGSWAVSTAPSVYGENETPKSIDAGVVAASAAGVGSLSEGQEDESQNNSVFSASAKMGKEHRALNAMINIVAPEFKQLDGGTGSGGGKGESMSDAETDEGSMAASDGDGDGDNGEVGNSGGSGSEDETDGDAVEDENEAMVEDSSG